MTLEGSIRLLECYPPPPPLIKGQSMLQPPVS
jgi:hypothetical protein